jgi:pimeloyl-ACP methyl ester carboxylesterase
MTTATVNNLTLGYDVIGDGEPMLLVMGLATQRIFWHDDFVKLLASEGFQVIRVDNRDIGESTHLDTPAPTRGQLVKALAHRRFAKPAYSLDDMADDEAALLTHLGVDRAHVVGVSMGGMIAQSLAIGHADRVRSLTSIMSNTGNRRYGRVAPSLIRKARAHLDPAPGDEVESGLAIWRLISGPHFDADEVRPLVERSIAVSDDEDGTARQMMAIAAAPDRTPDLRRLNVPTLVIHGLLDKLVMPSGGVATAKAIPGSRLLMFPDMAHDLPRPRWEEIAAAIVANARRAS